jgi:acyl-CoA hydrolase
MRTTETIEGALTMAVMTNSDTARRLTAEDAAALVRSGDWLDYGAVLAQPDAFDKALAARVGDLHNVNIRGCLSLRPRAVLEADPECGHFNFFNWHLGGYDRKLCDAGRESYIPCNLGEIPDYYRRFIDPPEIMVIKTCPVDASGYFNFGPANLWHGAVASRAKIVIVETDPAMPYVHGVENGLHESQVDYIIEGDGQPVPELPSPEPTDADSAVARLIAAEIDDGACLQIGIGAMPNAVCSLLMESGVRNLGVHTEMLTDGIIDLYRAGVVTGSAKTSHPGKIVCSFGLGSRKLYDTIDHNPDISCQPVEVTNLPHLIMQNDRLTTINNTTQMDLQGQAASESSGHRHISGSGGQLQFVRAGYASNGGKSFIYVFDLRTRRRAPQPHRAGPDTRQRRHRAPKRRDVRGHRVRTGQPEGEVHSRAGEGDDLARPSGFSRRPRAGSACQRSDLQIICLGEVVEQSTVRTAGP